MQNHIEDVRRRMARVEKSAEATEAARKQIEHIEQQRGAH